MINSSIEAQKAKIKDPQISKLFEMINETTEEAFNLLENLLRWTRNQNGKTKIYATLFNLTPVARQVVSLFSAIANAKEIELINRIAAVSYTHPLWDNGKFTGFSGRRKIYSSLLDNNT